MRKIWNWTWKWMVMGAVAAVLVSVAASCRHDEPKDRYLDVQKQFEPESVVIPWGYMTPEERRKYPREQFVVRFAAEMPEQDVFGPVDIDASAIDFNKSTLLLVYNLIPGYIRKVRYGWRYETAEDIYAFYAVYDISDYDENGEYDDNMFTYYRTAVLVDKIPADAKVGFSLSYNPVQRYEPAP